MKLAPSEPLSDERLREIEEAVKRHGLVGLGFDRDELPSELVLRIIAALQEARRQIERNALAYMAREMATIKRAEAAEAERGRLQNEIEALKAQLRAKVEFAIGERDALTPKEPSNG